MAVFKRRLCTSRACSTEKRDGKLLRGELPRCSKCGAPTEYTASWYVSVRVRTAKGLKKVTRAVSGSKEEAQAEERRLLTARRSGTIERPGTKTDFTSAVDLFREWMQEAQALGTLSANSVRAYTSRLDSALVPHFAGTDLRQLDHQGLKSYLKARRGQGTRQGEAPSPATLNRELATLKRLCSVAVEAGVIRHNPLIGFRLLPENNTRERHLSRGEIDALMAEAGKPQYPAHLRPILAVALNTGLRREGCMSLRWEEIDVARQEVVKVVKGGSVVRIPMTPALRHTLDTWRRRDGVTRSHGLCFPSPKTGKAMLVTSQFGFETACKAVGLEGVVFHSLRHTFATLFLEQYPDQIETLRVLLGHSSSYITRRYAHITDRSRHETMGNFGVGM